MLDNEFEKWCEQLLTDGKVDSIGYLKLLHQCGHVWEACRKKCADLCMQSGQKGMAMQIMSNIDGSIDELWMESHRDD